MGTWHLHSNDGWQTITFQPKNTFQAKGKRLILAEITLSGKSWNRQLRSQKKPGWGTCARDFTFNLHQVILSEDRLKLLIGKIDTWLRTPINELAVTELEAAEELGEEKDQSLRIEFSRGGQSRTMCDRPMCSLRYFDDGYHHKMTEEIHFETDPTSLQNFIDEVKQYLAQTKDA